MGLSPPLSSGLDPESSSGQKFSSSSSDGPREGGVEGQRLRYLLCPLCADLLLTEVEIHQARVVLAQPTRRLPPVRHFLEASPICHTILHKSIQGCAVGCCSEQANRTAAPKVATVALVPSLSPNSQLPGLPSQRKEGRRGDSGGKASADEERRGEPGRAATRGRAPDGRGWMGRVIPAAGRLGEGSRPSRQLTGVGSLAPPRHSCARFLAQFSFPDFSFFISAPHETNSRNQHACALPLQFIWTCSAQHRSTNRKRERIAVPRSWPQKQ